MAAKAKKTFTVYFDLPRVQYSVSIMADTFEEALVEARKYTTYKVLNDPKRELADYDSVEISGIYKQD